MSAIYKAGYWLRGGGGDSLTKEEVEEIVKEIIEAGGIDDARIAEDDEINDAIDNLDNL
jgi:hypothetical protein